MIMNAYSPYADDVHMVGLEASVATLADGVPARTHLDPPSSFLEAIDELVCEQRFNILTAASRVYGNSREEVDQAVAKIVIALNHDMTSVVNVIKATRLSGEVHEALAEAKERGLIRPVSDEMMAAFRDASPCDWLSSWPVEVAELRLASERGVVAAAILGSTARREETLSKEQAHELTALWLEGTQALLRWIATSFGDCVPFDIVPVGERVNVVVAEQGQAHWQRFVDRTRAAAE